MSRLMINDYFKQLDLIKTVSGSGVSFLLPNIR